MVSASDGMLSQAVTRIFALFVTKMSPNVKKNKYKTKFIVYKVSTFSHVKSLGITLHFGTTSVWSDGDCDVSSICNAH